MRRAAFEGDVAIMSLILKPEAEFGVGGTVYIYLTWSNKGALFIAEGSVIMSPVVCC